MKIAYRNDTLTIQLSLSKEWTRRAMEEDLEWYKDFIKRNKPTGTTLSMLRNHMRIIMKKLGRI